MKFASITREALEETLTNVSSYTNNTGTNARKGMRQIRSMVFRSPKLSDIPDPIIIKEESIDVESNAPIKLGRIDLMVFKLLKVIVKKPREICIQDLTRICSKAYPSEAVFNKSSCSAGQYIAYSLKRMKIDNIYKKGNDRILIVTPSIIKNRERKIIRGESNET